MTDKSYCRLVLAYLFWLAVVAWLGFTPIDSPGADVFLYRAYIALYPTAFFWVLAALIKGAFRGRA